MESPSLPSSDAGGLWPLVSTRHACPESVPPSDVVGGLIAHRVLLFFTQWLQRQHSRKDARLQARICPGHVVSVVLGTFSSFEIASQLTTGLENPLLGVLGAFVLCI